MMKMLLFLMAASCFSLSSCKKLIEDEKKEALIEAITTGQWKVESYMEGTVALTDKFAGYRFKFNRDGSVTGQLDTSITEGTWAGDLLNYSITSMFPNAADPLKKLNGTWTVTDSEADFVAAEMNTANEKMILHLRKSV